MAVERRQQIVWALYELLTRSSYDGVTVKSIATQAGVAPGLVHHYFANKDAIYTELASALRERYESLLDEHLNSLSVSSDRREATVDFIVDQFILDRPLNRAFHNLVQMSLDNEAVRTPIQGLLDRYRDRLEPEFESSGLGGAAIVGLIEGLALQHLVDPSKLGRDDLLAILTPFLAPDEEMR